VPKKAIAGIVPTDRVGAIMMHRGFRDVVPARGSTATAGLLVACLAAAWLAGAVRAAERGFVQDERSYAVFDALFLQRDNAAIERPLVVDTAAGDATLISAGDPASTVGTGARLFYGNYGAEDLGWEAGYLGVWNMRSDRRATSPTDSLVAGSVVFGEQTGLIGSDARTTDSASINSVELNLVWHRYDGGFNRRSGRPAQRCDGYDGGLIDWIGGFRWVNLEDAAVLSVTPTAATQASTYSARTSSNLFAGQVGVRGRMAFERWAVEGFTKIGIAGTVLSQSQSLYDTFAPTSPLRLPQSGSDAGMGMIADMNLSAIYRIDDVWGLRVGYNLMWITGVALAPDQWNFSTSQAAGVGSAVAGTGSMFLSGGSLGLEARW